MQDSSDSRLDAMIASSLRGSAHARPGQQQRAWERLRARAAAQDMLPAVAAEAARPVGWAVVVAAIRSALRWLIWLCLEESRYERAMRHRLDAYPLVFHGEPHSAGIWSHSTICQAG